MSQIVTRKGPVGEDKDKRQTDSPVKEMKKKLAANAEKEKQAAEKIAEKSTQSDKKSEKPKEQTEKAKDKEHTEKPSDKPVDKKDKSDKTLDKSIEKKDKVDKTDKKETSDKKESVEKPAEKKEKSAEKKEPQPEKSNESSKDKGGKADTPEDKTKKPEQKVRENGGKVNGEQNGDTVSSEEELQESDVERDEMFPELTYDDSDVECFEPPTPEGLPSRSYTRRSQVKATRTPETPRPASEKNVDKDYVPEDSKLLKLKDDTLLSDRKLRSADSPKPQDRKIENIQEAKKGDSPKKDTLKVVEEQKEEEKEIGKEIEIEVVVEVENEDEARVKSDTNYSKSRVKVSPYRRSSRLGDQTNTSLVANYTGNNTTMEMDITETSSFIEEAESPYLSGLRSIRGRRSYKPLKEMALRNIGINRSTRSATSVNLSENPIRPTGTVVGRKRKPDSEDSIEIGTEAEEHTRTKRARILERLARPFRHTVAPARSDDIVGINTDLPLPTLVAVETPEAIKPSPTISNPLPTTNERDSKKCVVM